MKNLFSVILTSVFILVSIYAMSQTLILGNTLSKQIKSGEEHKYEVELKAAFNSQIEVMQKSVDVEVTLTNKANKVLQKIDSPNGSNGPERVNFTADASGIYYIIVKTLEKNTKGNYNITFQYSMDSATTKKYQSYALNTDDYQKFCGTYILPDSTEILFGVYSLKVESFSRVFFTYHNLKTNDTRALMAISNRIFYCGKTLEPSFPIENEFEFMLSNTGEVIEVNIYKTDNKPIVAKRKQTHTYENFSVQNGDVILKGHLLLPKTKGKHPVIIHVHGSQGANRTMSTCDVFLTRLGFAVCSFDKRGAGESKGDWKTASLDDLSDDVIKVADYMRSRNDIDTSKLGLFGISQGGWISAIAASKTSKIKFITVMSGSGVPVWENVVHENEGNLRQLGISGAVLDSALVYAGNVLKMASHGNDWNKINKYMKLYKKELYSRMIFPAALPKDNFWWDWFKINGMYDSYTYLQKVHCPVLWQMGEFDWNVPTKKSYTRINQALKLAHNNQVEIDMISKANHSMLETSTGFDRENTIRYAEGFWTNLERWLIINIIK